MDMNEGIGFQRLLPLYNEAKKSNRFIYDKNKKMWYTPDHFKEKYDNKKLTESLINNLLKDLVIKDAVADLPTGQKQLIEKIDKFRTEIAEELRKLSASDQKN